jgi:exodeoxyribonuclease-3
LWIDIHSPEKQQGLSGFLPEEREWFQQFIDLGFVDTFRAKNNDPGNYSWWSYRAGSRQKNKGWRIDYHIITENLKNEIVNVGLHTDAIHSDHCPVSLEINL